jgi:hypothetical protein
VALVDMMAKLLKPVPFMNMAKKALTYVKTI